LKIRKKPGQPTNTQTAQIASFSTPSTQLRKEKADRIVFDRRAEDSATILQIAHDSNTGSPKAFSLQLSLQSDDDTSRDDIHQ